MFANQETRRFSLLAALMAASLSFAGTAARAQQLFYEDFEDETLSAGAAINGNVTIANGIASASDPTGARAPFSVVMDLPYETMTFSFDVVAPVVETTTARMEFLFRAGVGTDANTLGSGDQNAEAILFRGLTPQQIPLGARAPYVNNGNETIFLIYNNREDPVTYTSPVDSSQLTLQRFQYSTYILNNATTTWSQFRAPGNMSNGTGVPFPAVGTPIRATTRFGIGSSSTADVGTFAIDNVLLMSGATFERNLVTKKPGDVDDDMDVDLDDYAAIRNHFQQLVTMRNEGDLNNDGKVDFRDFRQWKANYVPPPGTPADAAVPEPASGLLAVAAAVVCTVRRHSSRRVSQGKLCTWR